MTTHFADRLHDRISACRAPVCVGIDPRYDKLPPALQTAGADPAGQVACIRRFCDGVLEAVAGIVPVVKPQIAYFEAHRGPGVQLYYDVVRRARQLGLLVIGDAKRNDIGSTAEAYAEGHLTGEDDVDALTVNGYLGADGLEPFIEAARTNGRGLFVLVRTSNPSAAAVQDFRDRDGMYFYERMADCVAALGAREGLIGRCGYSLVGAVVGATWPDEARRLRQRMPQQVVLVPGYGAQGATASDCAASFRDDGTGAIVNASRSVIYAHSRKEYAGLDWQAAVAKAAEEFAADLRQATQPA